MYISYRIVSSICRVKVLAWRDDGREGKEREELYKKGGTLLFYPKCLFKILLIPGMRQKMYNRGWYIWRA